MSHTEQFQGRRDGAEVQRSVTHHYRNIGSLCSLSIFTIDEPTMRTLQQSDPSDSLSTSPNNQFAPSSLAKKPYTAFEFKLSGREVLKRPSSRPITIAPAATRRYWNFNRPAWSRISQSPSTAFLHIICRFTAFLPRDHQDNSCTGHKSSSGKDRENLT